MTRLFKSVIKILLVALALSIYIPSSASAFHGDLGIENGGLSNCEFTYETVSFDDDKGSTGQSYPFPQPYADTSFESYPGYLQITVSCPQTTGHSGRVSRYIMQGALAGSPVDVGQFFSYGGVEDYTHKIIVDVAGDGAVSNERLKFSDDPLKTYSIGDVSNRGEAKNYYLANFGGNNFDEESDSRDLGIVTDSPEDSSEEDKKEQEQEDLDNQCASAGGMAWAICPMIVLLDSGLSLLDRLIINILYVDNNQFDNDGIKGASAVLRNLAYAILVPIMLVMIIGTALGFEFVSAYTMKKALPRMLFAVIFIALSYEITVFMVEFANAVGKGTLGFLTAPFGNGVSDLSLDNLYGARSDGSGPLQGIITAVKGIGLLAGVVALVWLFGITVFLFAAIGFLTLMARQMFIVLLIMLAPLAILSWIFPGNDKLWKSWWSIFTKLLIMFPLIMGLIASGRIFAYIIQSGGSGSFSGDILSALGKLTAYIIPYALIPLTFKFAGGLFATVTGAINDKSKGMFDRAKKSRGAKIERTAKGNMFKRAPENSVRSGLNTLGAGALNINEAGLNPKRMKSRLGSKLAENSSMEMRELMDKDPAIAAVNKDDTLAKATQLGRNRSDIEKIIRKDPRYSAHSPAEMAEAVATVERAQAAGSGKAVRGAMSIARAESGTGYNDASEMYESIIHAAGGDKQLEGQLLAAARSGSERAKRPDLALPGHTDSAASMDVLRATIGEPEGPRHTAARARVNSTARRQAFEAGGAHAVVSGKPKAVEKTVGELGAEFKRAMSSGDEPAAIELASQITSVRGAMGSASPDARKIITNMLTDVGVDITALNSLGQPYSVDEQLGVIIGHNDDPKKDTSQTTTQEIRSRAGLYDTGGANLTDEQIEARRIQAGGPPR